jgi:predicted anti-sigma-YlaC factor YlaD
MPFGRRLQVWFHLALCRNCRIYMKQMKATARLLGHLPAATAQEALSDATREELMRRFSALHPDSASHPAPQAPLPKP